MRYFQTDVWPVPKNPVKKPQIQILAVCLCKFIFEALFRFVTLFQNDGSVTE